VALNRVWFGWVCRWVITFSATFAYFFRSTTAHARFTSRFDRGNYEHRPLSLRDCAWTVAKLSALSTPVMMVQMTIFQMGTGVDLIIANGGLPPSPAPGPRGMLACLALYGRTIWRARRQQPKDAPPPSGAEGADLLANLHLLVYFATLLLVMLVWEPETHVSTSMQQRYGPCGHVHLDITGNDVTEFVCAAEADEDYSFDCPHEDGSALRSEAFQAAGYGLKSVEQAPTVEVVSESGRSVQVREWYTVCGVPHSDYAAWVGAELTLAVAGAATYSALLGGWRWAVGGSGGRWTAEDYGG